MGAVFMAGCHSSNIRTSISRNATPSELREYRVAVISSAQTPESIAFSDMLTTELLPLGFRVIERNRLAAILAEQQMSISGIIERADYEVLGKIAELDAVFIFMAKYNGETIGACVLKLVDVKTGEVLLSTTYDKSLSKDNQGLPMSRVVRNISDSISGYLR
ncbi:MAG TPA: CsgG/HfaB family protein [Elusimicrobiales bacterium]|nr:CsgG/HfaB family protein [Elusimicrobiales bacterium]